jgi:hypothetical protein
MAQGMRPIIPCFTLVAFFIIMIAFGEDRIEGMNCVMKL